MIKEFISKAETGDPVYINSVYDGFQELNDSESQVMHCILTMLEEGAQRYFPLRIPMFSKMKKRQHLFMNMSGLNSIIYSQASAEQGWISI